MKGKRGILFFAVACALVIGAVHPALAHGRAWGPEGGAGRPGETGVGAMPWLNPRTLDDLKLTAEQRERVRELFRETFREREENRKSLHRELLREIRRGGELDPSLRKDLENETMKRITDKTRLLAKLYAVLSPGQRSILQSKLDRLGTAKNEWRNRPEFPMGRLAERLNLNEAQKTRAEVLFKAWEKPMEARREQMRRLETELAKRAFSPNPDFRRLEADARRLSELAVEGIFERSRHMDQFRSMLTEEQKRMLDEGPRGFCPRKRSW